MAIRLRFDWNDERAIEGSGFRFGNCLICVAPPERALLGAPNLVLLDHPGRSLQVHTRLVPFDREVEPFGPQVLAMMLDDDEESLFPDFSQAYVLTARVGSRVKVNRHDRSVHGEIVDSERLVGNYRYIVWVSETNALEGAPVFLEEDDHLVGMVASVGPGFLTVLGIEPLTSQATLSGLFRSPSRSRRSLGEAFEALLPDSVAREQSRERVGRMNLFVREDDYSKT